jgi:CLIP-associating protein 1/2
MNEKVTDAQAVDLLVFLRTDASVDAKVAQINIAKSGIKHNNVPEAAVAPLFETTRTSMVSQHAALVNAGFSTLNHLLERLVRQEPKYIAKETVRTLPLVIEKLGDHKEKYRIIAAQCLITFWRVSPAEVERTVRDTAMRGKNPRAKEASLHWLVQVSYCQYSL